MTKKLFIALLVFFPFMALSQEVVPEKKFRYSISYTGVKSQEFAISIQDSLSTIPGISQANMNWPSYMLSFVTTNHQTAKYDPLRFVKGILEHFGVSMIKISREELQ